MSYQKKVWNIGPKIDSLQHFLVCALSKIEPHKQDAFLHPSFEALYDEQLLHDFSKGVDRIIQAIEKQERIVVFGDFDTDGITSTALLVTGISRLGGTVSYRIPDREKDSHGLKNHHIDALAEKKVDLIITCDCGGNDHEVIAYAASRGIDVVVTDHHESHPDQFPNKAVAVINPQVKDCAYPYKHLAGVGVAFKVLMGVAQHFLDDTDVTTFTPPFLELVALGTIADCMVLDDENRVLVHYGLLAMQQTSWPGLQMLFDRAEINTSLLNEDTIRFAIAPRLNAASRMGDVLHALQLFVGDTSGHKERLLYLDQMNQERQSLTNEALLEAKKQVDVSPVIIVFHKEWRPGVLGLIAGKLVEQYGRPVVAMSEFEGHIHASCRSIPEVSIIKGVEQVKDLLLYYGGHAGAAGFRLEKKNQKALEEQLKHYYADHPMPESILEVFGSLSADLLDLDFAGSFHALRPFGEGNPIPRFVLPAVEIEDWKLMGKEQNHIRLMGGFEGKPITMVGFFMGDLADLLERGERYDCVVELDESVWQGVHRLDIRLVDIEKVSFGGSGGG